MSIEIFYTDQSRAYKSKNGDLVLRDTNSLNDIYVKKNNHFYSIIVDDFTSFIWCYKELVEESLKIMNPDICNELSKSNELIILPPNLVFSPDGLTKKAVVASLLALDDHYFYERLKPCEVINNEILLELSPKLKADYIEDGDSLTIPIKNLIKIYPDNER